MKTALKTFFFLVTLISCSDLDLNSKKFLDENERHDQLKTEMYYLDGQNSGEKEMLRNFYQSETWQWAIGNADFDFAANYEKAEKACNDIAFVLPTREQLRSEGEDAVKVSSIYSQLESMNSALEDEVYIKGESQSDIKPNSYSYQKRYLVCVREIPNSKS